MSAVDDLHLPCQPRVLALLMRELIAEAPNLRRVNQLFSADVALAAPLLKIANSAAFHMQGQVRSIAQAILLLGVRPLRALLRKAQYETAAHPMAGLDMVQFAHTSHVCAKLARSLAGWTGVDGSTAYMAALLHGLGQLRLHQTERERVAALDSSVGIWDPRRPRLELKHWGYSAHHLTAALLQQWQMPADVVTAIETMEAPLSVDAFDPMAGVLHLAAWCSRVRHSGWSERTMADAFPVDVALALGVDVDVVLQREAPDWSQSIY